MHRASIRWTAEPDGRPYVKMDGTRPLFPAPTVREAIDAAIAYTGRPARNSWDAASDARRERGD